jgi:chemotaxis response regulator CheB
MTVQIVDDSKVAHSIVRECVETMGHQVIGETKYGVEGLDLCLQLKPEVVAAIGVIKKLGMMKRYLNFLKKNVGLSLIPSW